MRKVLELNEKTEISSLYSVILLFQPHFPVFLLCLSYYLTEFVPRLFPESDIALIFSSGKQFLDNYLATSPPLSLTPSITVHSFSADATKAQSDSNIWLLKYKSDKFR